MTEIYGTIYCATNMTDGKKYVGATRYSLDRRRAQHLCLAKRDNPTMGISKAIKEYGHGSFKWEVLAECKSVDEWRDAEIKYIKKLKTKSLEYGYNTKSGSKCEYPEYLLKPNDKIFSVTIPAETYAQLKKIAYEKDVKLGQLVRHILKGYCSK